MTLARSARFWLSPFVLALLLALAALLLHTVDAAGCIPSQAVV